MHTLTDHYAVLGVSPDANEQEIKEAYRHLAKQYHPDLNKEPGAQARFIEITAAYDTLGDPAKRRDYDVLRATYLRGIHASQPWQETIPTQPPSQPSYTPPPPHYQAPRPSSPPRRSTPARRFGSKSRLVLLLALLLPIIGGSLGLFYVTKQQIASDNAAATATAQARAHAATVVANANATAYATSTAMAATATSSAEEATTTAQADITATAQADITATAQANATATVQANATATALASRSPDASFSKLVLNDPLVDSSKGYGWNGLQCQFAAGGYTTTASGGYSYCLAAKTDFRDFVYQVQATIIQGDCAGILFRMNGDAYDFFLICQDQSYAFYVHKPGEQLLSSVASGTSPAIQPGLNQSNFVAVAAQGSSIKLYVNHTPIGQVNDTVTTHGQIGLIADALSSPLTHATFRSAEVWVRR